jgi:hypothetical protein
LALFTLGKEHEEAFKEVLDMANAWNMHKSIQATLYVLSAIDIVRKNWEKVFNIQGCYMIPDAIDHLSLSAGERVLFALAANLYNGTIIKDVPLSPNSAFDWLDHSHRLLYMQALQYAYLFHEIPISVRLTA